MSEESFQGLLKDWNNILDDLVKIPSDIKYLNGKIADLRLYNTIKTEDEINTIYNQYSR